MREERMIGSVGSEDGSTTPRLLVVSNRLPVTIKRVSDAPDAPWAYSPSSGGLVAALSGLKKMLSFTWIGWPGLEVDAESQTRLATELLETQSCMPVFLPAEVASLHYNGFSNSTLWPLFHYLPGEIDFDEAQWDGYYRVNVAFAAAIKEIARDGDLIWVQDYHLMLLPALLREMLDGLSGIRIGFFLHTPFPSSEVYRVLPVRKQILLGVLQCDLIGFHTYDYARHFLSSCSRILGLSTMPNGVEFDGRFVQVGTFPIGIDPDQFIRAVEEPSVRERIAELEEQFAGKKVLVGVDRLDYIKGVPHKLYAFDQFLTRHPEFQGRAVLIQVAVPTRTEVEEYKNLRTLVNELIGGINGKFGTFEYTPVQYLYRSIDFEELVALYRIADACIVTSTRDGMNLVSYEYIATQAGKNGALVLSEFAGAAQSMNGAIIVNPWNIEQLAEAYYEALTTAPDTAAANHQKLLRYVTKYTASQWGLSFVAELRKIADNLKDVRSYVKLPVASVKELFSSCENYRILMVDYDGTINASGPGLEYTRRSLRLVESISRLANLPKTYVYVLSGCTRAHAESLFANSDVGLICEHGCFVRHPTALRAPLALERPSQDPVDEQCWVDLAYSGDESWKTAVRPLLKFYTDQTPGSFVEEKEKILAWNFCEADPEFGIWQASELQNSLERVLSSAPVEVVLVPKVVEIKPSVVDKPAPIKRIFEDLGHLGIKVDFLLFVGDHRTEEATFSALEQQLQDGALFTATVGKRRSSARYYVDTASDIDLLLASLVQSG